MNRMDNLSQNKIETHIFSPVAFIDPNLYYNSILNRSILENEQFNYEITNNDINDLNKKESKKNNNTIEISLISLLNAISEYNESKSNSEKIEKSNESELINETKDIKENIGIMDLLTQKIKRNQKYCDACPHHNAPHYAKGMCSNCYHSKGREKKPWNCPHSKKFHYALGLCQNCYQMRYMKKQNDEGGKINTGSELIEISNDSNSFEKKGKKKTGRHSKK